MDQNPPIDHSPVEIPFLLSTAPAGRADKYAASAIMLLSLAGQAVALPYANMHWPKLPAFIPAYGSGIIVIDLITAILLIAQFRLARTPSVLVLVAGYVFDALVMTIYVLSFPDVFAAEGLLGANDQTTAWLYSLRHGLFPSFLLIYAFLSGSRWDRPFSKRRIFPAIGGGGLAVITLAAFCAWFATGDMHGLPVLVRAGNYSTGVSAGVIPTAAAFNLAAMLALYTRTRLRRVLDVWLFVVSFAWLLDVLTSGIISSERFNFGWYAGRMYGLLAASLVLSALLVETSALYLGLTRLLAETRRQSDALLRSEVALRQAQKMEAIGQLTGGVAHDFNNLLTVVIGSLDIVRRRPGDDQRSAKLIDNALSAALRGEQLTKQLLTFARRQVMRLEIVNVNRLILNFDALVRRAVGEGIEITLDLEDGIGAIEVDPAQFEAAILNLAVNARDAMEGSGTLRIQSRNVPLDVADTVAHPGLKPGDYVMVAVSDTGAGMDAETSARAFEPFFTTKDVGKGSGLGLSQVYGFTKSAGGYVKIESNPGAGARVILYLPRIAGPVPVAPHPISPVRAPDRPSRETVLIVEDEAAVLEMGVETLAELGYEVMTAMDGATALERIRVDPTIDIVFSDVVMPGGMNGAELAAAARRIRPGLKILLTSGYAASALAGDTPLPDDIDLIRKPYRRDELQQKLRAALNAGVG